jgi:hypothetical protein
MTTMPSLSRTMAHRSPSADAVHCGTVTAVTIAIAATITAAIFHLSCLMSMVPF